MCKAGRWTMFWSVQTSWVCLVFAYCIRAHWFGDRTWWLYSLCCRLIFCIHSLSLSHGIHLRLLNVWCYNWLGKRKHHRSRFLGFSLWLLVGVPWNLRSLWLCTTRWWTARNTFINAVGSTARWNCVYQWCAAWQFHLLWITATTMTRWSTRLQYDIKINIF